MILSVGSTVAYLSSRTLIPTGIILMRRQVSVALWNRVEQGILYSE